jgi:hypothetical protein
LESVCGGRAGAAAGALAVFAGYKERKYIAELKEDKVSGICTIIHNSSIMHAYICIMH